MNKYSTTPKDDDKSFIEITNLDQTEQSPDYI